MSRTKLIRIAGVATGGALAMGVLGVALLEMYNSGLWDQAGDSLAWYAPLLVGAAIATLVWVVLAAGASDDADVGMGVNSCCTVCGGAIHSDWRLCPHCGERLPGPEHR